MKHNDNTSAQNAEDTQTLKRTPGEEHANSEDPASKTSAEPSPKTPATDPAEYTATRRRILQAAGAGLGLIALGGQSVAAQENNSTSDDPGLGDRAESAVENATGDAVEEVTGTTYVGEIDNVTRVVDFNWDAGTVTVTLESDRSSNAVTVTDSSQRIDGYINIRQEDRDLPEGRTEIEFTVENERNPAITLGTARGLCGIGRQPEPSGLNSPAPRLRAWVQGAGVTAAGTAAVAWRELNRDYDEPERIGEVKENRDDD